MPKSIVFNSLTAVVFSLLFLHLGNLTSFSDLWMPLIILSPLIPGMVSVLARDNGISKGYIPRILAGAILFGSVSVFIWRTTEYFSHNIGTAFLAYLNPVNSPGSDFFLLVLAAGMYMLGGFVGVAILGVNTLFFPNRQFRLNPNFTFLKSFLLGSLTILAANIYYVIYSTPPDSRWKFQLSATGLFVLAYLLLFFLVSKKIVKNSRINYLMWAYNFVLSLVFISCAMSAEMRYFGRLYWSYVDAMPYIVILGLGVVCFTPLALYLQRGDNKKIN